MNSDDTDNFFMRVTQSRQFRGFIIIAIVFAAILVGLETVTTLAQNYAGLLKFFDLLILAIFIIEAIFKILAEGSKPWRYFKDPWNQFDFAVVIACILAQVMSANGEFFVVLRLVRIVRIFRLVTVLPNLQLIVGTLLRSIPTMFYLFLLLTLLFYIYGTMGVFLFEIMILSILEI